MISKYDYLTVNGELSHHGILGQRWGIRRFQNKDGSLTSAGKKRYGVNQSEDKASAEKSQFHLSDKQKKMLKVGAIAAGTALAAYGAYKIGSNPDVQAAVRRGIETLKGKSNAFSSEQLKEMGIEVTDIDRVDIDKINFDGNSLDLNHQTTTVTENVYNHFGKSDTRGFDAIKDIGIVSSANTNGHDCGPSALALLENVNNGLNVKAKDVESGMTLGIIKKLYPTTKEFSAVGFDDIDNPTYNSINKQLRNKLKDGDNGLLALVSADSSKAPSHFITYSKENGKIVFRDPSATMVIGTNKIRGMEYSIDDQTVRVAGKTITGETAIRFIESNIFNRYNLDVTQYVPIKGHPMTDDVSLLDEYFDRLK